MNISQKVYLSFTFFSFFINAKHQTVYLTPPNLDDASIIIKGACDRPRRKEGVKISFEKTQTKSILHCYGHGGFGFTTLFGSIQEASDLFLQQKFDHTTPIRIIGAGCMGLTLAIELRRKGFTNISISTKERYNIPSWKAGGFFDPGTGTESTPQGKYHLDLGLKTLDTLLQVEQGNHPYLKSNIVKRLPIYYPSTIDCGVEILEKMNIVPKSEVVTIDFGNGIAYENFKKQYTYFINISLLMKELWHQVEYLNIPVTFEKILTFESCKEMIICNCAGIGSKELNKDASIEPARGHFFMIKSPVNEKPLEYLLFTKVMQEDKVEYIYFFPKQTFVSENGEEECTGLLGGTFIPCNELTENELQKLNQKEFQKLANRAHQFFYEGANA